MRSVPDLKKRGDYREPNATAQRYTIEIRYLIWIISVITSCISSIAYETICREIINTKYRNIKFV